MKRSLTAKDDGTLGGFIRYYRLKSELTQAELAKHLRIRPSQLNEVEKSTRPISLELAVRAARRLKVPSEVVIERWMLTKIRYELGDDLGVQYAVLCLKGANFRKDETEAYARYYGSLLAALDRIRQAFVQFDVRSALDGIVKHLSGNKSLLSNIEDLKKKDTVYRVLSNPPSGVNPTIETLQVMLNTLRSVSTPEMSNVGRTLVQK